MLKTELRDISVTGLLRQNSDIINSFDSLFCFTERYIQRNASRRELVSTQVSASCATSTGEYQSHFLMRQAGGVALCEPHDVQQGQVQDPAPGSVQSQVSILAGG